MKIIVFSIFTKIIEDFCFKSLLGKALESKKWDLKNVDIREYSEDKHKKVDDTPYGGEHGLVLKPDVIGRAIDENCNNDNKIIYFSPRGKLFNQNVVREYIKYDNIALICGRYEGIDERVIEEYNIEELSIGDFILMGGELPALIFIESIVRCVDGIIGDKNSLKYDSFGGLENDGTFNNLLEYPLYTKPQVWRGKKVPEVLLSGNHENIKKWKIEMAETITKTRRIDLWEKYNKKNNDLFGKI